MAIKYITLDAMPSWGALSSMDSYDELQEREAYNDYTRNRFREIYSNDYFGSEYDRYYQSFYDGIGSHIRRISGAARRMYDTVRDVITDDVIRRCNTEASLRNVPPRMYLPILTHRPIKDLLRLGRIQGYGNITHDEVDRVYEGYHYAIERNGRINMTAENYGTKNVKMGYRYHSDVPHMTADQIMDIRATREYIDELLDYTELDPTDLDMERG